MSGFTVPLHVVLAGFRRAPITLRLSDASRGCSIPPATRSDKCATGSAE